MRQLIISSLLVLLGIHLSAQSSNLIFFTEEGERFTLFVNGEQLNMQPETNVKVWDFHGEFAQVRVLFQDSELGELKKGIMVEPGMQSSWSIRKNKKGEYTLRFAGEVAKPVEERPARTVQAPPPTPPAVSQSTTTITTTQQTTTRQGEPQGAGLEIKIDDQGAQIHMNIDMEGINQSSGRLGVTTTTTTQTTTSYHENHSGVYYEESNQGYDSRPYPAHPAGCEFEMGNAEYQSALQSIQGKSFSDEKITVIKQVLRGNCVSVNQVIGFMQLFTFEEDKLAVAKAAYAKTLDQSNYFQVNDQFTYSDSVDELNAFLESQP